MKVGITCWPLTAVAAGAPIQAVNTVRRQLLRAAGGGLARAAAPAQVATLVLSDVIDDSLPDIGSGPTVASPTGTRDALNLLARYRVVDSVPESVRRLLAAARGEQPAPPLPPTCRTWVIGNNRTAVAAAAAHLEQRGYMTVSVSQPLTGEAAARGDQLAALALAMQPVARSALILGGETTVTVRGRGRGGRSQELALSAARRLAQASLPTALLAAGTDGIDGRSRHAGGIATPSTFERIRTAGIDPVSALFDNDSATALAASGDALITGPTGTNVGDLTVLLVQPQP